MSDTPHMDPEVMKGHLMKVGLIMQVAADIPVPDLIREVEYFDSFGVYFEPTAWMRTADTRQQNLKALRALEPFHRFASELVAPFANQKVVAAVVAAPVPSEDPWAGMGADEDEFPDDEDGAS